MSLNLPQGVLTMADNQTTRSEDTMQAERANAKPAVVNSGRFQKGSQRARDAGREGGKKSRRNS